MPFPFWVLVWPTTMPSGPTQPHILEQGKILGQTFQRLLHAGPQGSSLLIRRGSEKVVDARNARAVVQHIAQQTGHAFQLAGFTQDHHVEVFADLLLQGFFRAGIAEPGDRAEPQQRGQAEQRATFCPTIAISCHLSLLQSNDADSGVKKASQRRRPPEKNRFPAPEHPDWRKPMRIRAKWRAYAGFPSLGQVNFENAHSQN